MSISIKKREIRFEQLPPLSAVEIAIDKHSAILLISCDENYVVILHQDPNPSGALTHLNLESAIDDIYPILEEFGVQVNKEKLRQEIEKLL